MTGTELYDPAPLFRLETAKYGLAVESDMTLEPMEIVPQLRGRLGYILKKRFCPFHDFENRACTGCRRALGCIYTAVFSPTAGTAPDSNPSLGSHASRGMDPTTALPARASEPARATCSASWHS